ncbi:MAG: ComF family protein [Rhodocyclaceae bacterium]|nr:ComF family protein [Rhodocyclaceae bacterium]
MAVSISARLAGLAGPLLGQDCLLCGDSAGDRLLCPECAADLPRLPAEVCPRCAQPSPGGAVCGSCLRHPPAFDATRAAFRYGFPLDRLVQLLKFNHRLAVAPFLARAMLEGGVPAGDCLLPVPLSHRRLAERGFNQAQEIARCLARGSGLPLLSEACLRGLDTPPQSALPWKARRANIRRAFECRTDLTGRAVILVDDVMTSGATLDELAGVVRLHGAGPVVCWVAARAVRGED